MFNLFRRRRYWVTPAGECYDLFEDMANQTHLLIAGATGSGKSVVINGIITTLLYNSPNRVQFIFLDPKRVELVQYKHLPHCLTYATEPAEMVEALEYALAVTEERYKKMAEIGQRKYTAGAIYVVIDELADLMTTNKRYIMPPLQRLCQIGRAANVHVIAATQCPLAAVIPTPIKVNFDSRVGLRTRSAQDSRNILGVAGCETLPRYGYGYYMTADGIENYKIPYVKEEEINRLCAWWTSEECQTTKKPAQ